MRKPYTTLRQILRLACFSPLLLIACSRPDIDTEPVVRPVRVMEIVPSQASGQTSYPAEVQARYEATLSFQVSGRLIQRRVEVGQTVKKGQVLAQINPDDLKLALTAAESQFNAAKTEHDQAKIDLERALKLRGQEVISQAELDKLQVYYESTVSQLAQAKANLSAQRNQFAYASLVAPRDGVITQVFSEVGQVVAPGQPIVHWADPSTVQVKLSVPESRVHLYQVGRKATVVPWADEVKLQASIREVAPAADPLTRAYPIYLDIENTPIDLRIGMSATAFFEASLSSDAIVVPVSAVVADGLGAFVWVFDESAGVVQRRDIQANEVSAEGVLVSAGLTPGDLVVTAGTHVLSDGQKVKRFVESADIDKAIEEKRQSRQVGG